MKTTSTFWSQLEADIQKYSKRAKKNIKATETITNHRPSQHKIQQHKFNKLPIKSNSTELKKQITSINQIRNQYSLERNRQTKVKNRIHYLSVQRDRRVRSSSQVKQKYQKVNSIRSESRKEKNFINQEIQSYKNFYYQKQRSKVIQVKTQKQSIDKSCKSLLNQKAKMANSVRLTSRQNEEMIQQQKIREYAKKRQSVNQIQLAQQKSAEILKKMALRKIEFGKRQHQKKIWDQYKKLQLQNRKNNCIIKNFSQAVDKIESQKIKAEEELEMYRSFLGLGRSQKNPERSTSAVSRRDKPLTQSQKMVNQFYLT